MAIAKRPGQLQADIISAFISGANAETTKKPATDSKKTPAIIRFNADLLSRIDAAAAQRGVSRAAWINTVASRALDAGEW